MRLKSTLIAANKTEDVTSNLESSSGLYDPCMIDRKEGFETLVCPSTGKLVRYTVLIEAPVFE